MLLITKLFHGFIIITNFSFGQQFPSAGCDWFIGHLYELYDREKISHP